MKIHSGILLAAVLSANLISSENLMRADDVKSQNFVDAAEEADARVERISNADSIIVRNERVKPSTC
jgi:hypothetical protein